jgi:hypothetical protein
MTKRPRRSVQATRAVGARSRAAAPAAPGAQAVRLAGALQALASGLPNPWDESTDYFHRFVAVMRADTALDPESFRMAVGVGARYRIALSPADDRLARLADAEDEWGADIAGGFRQLHAVMRATLRDRSVAFARGNGVVRVRLWLFGRSDNGTLVGLRSISTET